MPRSAYKNLELEERLRVLGVRVEAETGRALLLAVAPQNLGAVELVAKAQLEPFGGVLAVGVPAVDRALQLVVLGGGADDGERDDGGDQDDP